MQSPGHFSPFFHDVRLPLVSTRSTPARLFLPPYLLPSLPPLHRPVLSRSLHRPRYLLLSLLTNNIKRPIRRHITRYNSRTSGHRKGARKRELRGGSQDGIWSSVCHARHAVHWCTQKERKKQTDRQTGREKERSREHGEASSRENHFELHSGEAIPSPTYDATERIAYAMRCRPRITWTRRASGADRPRSRREIRIMKLRLLRNYPTNRSHFVPAPFPPTSATVAAIVAAETRRRRDRKSVV